MTARWAVRAATTERAVRARIEDSAPAIERGTPKGVPCLFFQGRQDSNKNHPAGLLWVDPICYFHHTRFSLQWQKANTILIHFRKF